MFGCLPSWKSAPRKKIDPDDRKHAFSLGGNLVKELTVPITDYYDVSRTLLGRGSSAEVVIGEHLKSGHRFAIKIIDITRKSVIWRYNREKNFLKDIEHTNIIRLYEVYTSPTAMFFVMELCTGGHLAQLLKNTTDGNLDEPVAREFTLQIVRAMYHVHSKGICHRDIKLQNILLENHTPEAQIKIVDFGNAVEFIGNLPLTKVVGTTYTAAPEVFRQEYDEKCDIWSIGVVVYILLSGRRPFERVELNPNVRGGGGATASQKKLIGKDIPIKSKDATVIANILMGRYHFQHTIFSTISDAAIDFLKTCLTMDYKNRASIEDLLHHPWLSNPTISNRFQYLNSLPTFSSPTASASAPVSLPTSAVMSALTTNTPSKQQANRGALALRNSTIRHLEQHHNHHHGFGGMRHTCMLAIAFAMPIMKAKQIRAIFQEIDRNGNGLIGKLFFKKNFL